MMNAFDPYKDDVLNPLKELTTLAEENGFSVSGDIGVTSDCGDYDNICIRVSDNKFEFLNLEIVNAGSDELVAELERRGYKVEPPEPEKEE